jgi:hypothetical protein
MFFADPTAAFANLARALARHGRVVFVCWQELGRNPWMLVPLLAAGKHVPLPPPPEPGTPGPMSLADPERVRAILEAAGLRDVRIEPLERALSVGGGGGLDEAVEFMLQGVGPTSRILADAPPALRARVVESVREAMAPFQTEQGVRMDAAAWIVHARR